MGNQTIDTRLARQLQKRGKWSSYVSCLREVQKWLARTECTPKEIRERIDAGELDPPEGDANEVPVHK